MRGTRGRRGRSGPAGPGVAVSDHTAVQAGGGRHRGPSTRGGDAAGARGSPARSECDVGWEEVGQGQPRAWELLSRQLCPASCKPSHSVTRLPTRLQWLPPLRTEPTLPARLPRPLSTRASPIPTRRRRVLGALRPPPSPAVVSMGPAPEGSQLTRVNRGEGGPPSERVWGQGPRMRGPDTSTMGREPQET